MAIIDNLEAFWELEETSGTRVDSHGANDLADNNTVLSATGKIGTAADFEFDNAEYLSIADNASLSLGDIDATFCAWVKIETKAISPGAQNILAKDNEVATEREYLIDFTAASNRFRFGVFDAATGNTFSSVLANNLGAPSIATWYFIVAWHDATANTLNIQVNNGTVDSVSYSLGIRNSVSGFALGGRVSGTSSFDGLIDQVGLWKRVLTSDERTWLYNAGAGRSYAEIVTGMPAGGVMPLLMAHYEG